METNGSISNSHDIQPSDASDIASREKPTEKVVFINHGTFLPRFSPTQEKRKEKELSFRYKPLIFLPVTTMIPWFMLVHLKFGTLYSFIHKSPSCVVNNGCCWKIGVGCVMHDLIHVRSIQIRTFLQHMKKSFILMSQSRLCQIINISKFYTLSAA